MRSLYEINKDYLEVIENSFKVDEETGEILFSVDDLETLETEFKDKVDNVACYIKDLEALNASIKEEKKALDDRLKANDKKVKALKEYIVTGLNIRDMQGLETPRNKISFRKSSSVEVLNEDLIDRKYFKEKIEYSLDKKAVMAELKSGNPVAGCMLLEKDNLQIK